MYRAAPVTQRDGSRLANSNCRMASVATGIDFHTLGSQLSTGAKMRARQDDQEGGTDSGDARKAWTSYEEALRVKDGAPWADALADLKAGRLVHLDVWHATCGGPCLSGSGGYGHTIAVAPEHRLNSSTGKNQWLTADPWCNPPKWVWWDQTKLEAGAEKWGNQVYGTARQTSGGGEPSPELLRRVVRELFNRWTPGGRERVGTPPDMDTGGPPRIMYTTTKTQATTAGGEDAVGIYYNPGRWTLTKDLPVYLDTSGALKITTLKAGAVITSLGTKAVQEPAGGNGQDSTWRAVVVRTGALVIGDSPLLNAILWCKDADMPADSTPTDQAWDNSIWNLMGTPTGRFPCPTTPPPPVVDCAAQVKTAVDARDTQWEEALEHGNPWPSAD